METKQVGPEKPAPYWCQVCIRAKKGQIVDWWRNKSRIRGIPPVVDLAEPGGPPEWTCQECRQPVPMPSETRTRLDQIEAAERAGVALREQQNVESVRSLLAGDEEPGAV